MRASNRRVFIGLCLFVIVVNLGSAVLTVHAGQYGFAMVHGAIIGAYIFLAVLEVVK